MFSLIGIVYFIILQCTFHSIRFTELLTDKYMISTLLKLVKFLCLSQNMFSEPFQDEWPAFTCYYRCCPWLGAIQVWLLLQTAWPSAIHVKILWYIYVPSDKHACWALYWYIILVYLEKSLTVKHYIFVHISHIHHI